MQVVLALKKIEDRFEAALIVDNKFTRSGSDKSINALVAKFLGPILSVEQPEGVEIAISVGVILPEVKEDEPKSTA